MKRKNATRNALFTSILSLLLCVSMLVGTTFAWFTDSVVSGNNVIAAGNLDIELYNDGNKVTESTNLFENVLWEPGVAIYENFTIKNEGNLALLYDFAINWGDYNTLAGQYNLTQILKVAMVDGHVSGNREAVIAKGEGKWAALDTWSFSGEMTKKGDTKNFALIIYWEPSDNDNNWNVQNGKTLDKGDHLYVNLGINLQATQKMHESDSFGPDYDSLANPWDGSAGEVPAEENGVITITTAAELAALSKEVAEGNNFNGKTVKLAADINLDGKAWAPIGRMINTSGTGENSTFKGNFDGQGHTIYNLNVDTVDEVSDTNKGAGLFGAITGNISNVNVVNATINTNHWAGVIAGSIEGSITNCSVTNATITCLTEKVEGKWDNGDKAGAIAGYATHGTIENCSVTDATITAYRDLGAIVGASYNSVVKGTVSNVTLIKENSVDYKGTDDDTTVNAYVGTVYGGATVDATGNVTIIEAVSVTVSTADQLREALNSDADNINIVLANDISIDIGTGWNMGGAETESITINGNGKTLTLSSTYRSYFNLANAEGKLYLNDMTLTNAHTGGHFFDYTTHFNCDVEATNVAFAKAPLINASATATLTNCKFDQPSVDGYGLWIMSGANVTVTGGTVNSERGIKITDEDSADEKTTLAVSGTKFNNTEKAAILVTTAHGADVKLDNVDISNSRDTVHAVWVDEERAENTATVTGGKVIWEAKVVSSSTELTDAVAAGKTDLWLLDGEYDVANCKNATLTLSGTEDAVIVHKNEGEQGCDYAFEGSTVTFKGVTIDTTKNTSDWAWGFARMNANYEKCTINGTYFLYGISKFENCKFNVSGNAYNIWTYGSSAATFTECTFNCDGKAIYADGNGATGTKLTVTKCTFNDRTNGTSGYAKAAIETGTTYGQTYELIISGVTVNGFGVNPDGIVTNSTIWANKHSMTTEKLNVVVDGTDVY